MADTASEARIIPGSGGGTPGDADGSWGRFTRNLGNQFRNAATKDSAVKIADKLTLANHFRHAGMGAALRYTAGLPQLPTHMSDYLNGQLTRKQRGLDPDEFIGEHKQRPGWTDRPQAGPGVNARNRQAWQAMTGQNIPPGEA